MRGVDSVTGEGWGSDEVELPSRSNDSHGSCFLLRCPLCTVSHYLLSPICRRISTMKEGEGVVGKRVQIMMACSIGMALVSSRDRSYDC